ncbi:hypothetical protein BH10CHL1_BH10CHL1_12490 [soil metagenome]
MDEVAHYNIKRWKALAEANALFTRPYLDLDAAAAHAKLDPEGRLGDLKDKTVLCLAGGGGQQSVAFTLLGAQVTVIDLSEEQLQRDREAAAHYQFNVETYQADMRHFAHLVTQRFDVVWQPYALNFVPDARAVFQEVANVLRPGGLYRFSCANPFFSGLSERDWNGTGYLLKSPYQEGAATTYPDQPWVADASTPIPQPREYRHTLSTLVNGLLEQSFVIQHLSDSTDFYPDANAEPGTWDHFTAIAPPWLTFWTLYQPKSKGVVS